MFKSRARAAKSKHFDPAGRSLVKGRHVLQIHVLQYAVVMSIACHAGDSGSIPLEVAFHTAGI